MGILKKAVEGVAKVINKGKDIFEPVEGMTFDEWALANAKLVSGTSVEDLIKSLGMDTPKWDRINNEWLTRMSNDISYTLSIRYASFFNKNASGNLPNTKEITEDTYPFEKYIEVIVAMDYLGRQGKDAEEVLKDFGLTVADYSNLSAYWSKKIMFSPLDLGVMMQNLMMEYRAKYEKLTEGGGHSDIEF